MEYFCDFENRKSKELLPGVTIKTFWGKEMLLSQVNLEPNSVIPSHNHPHEQSGTVISGKMELTIDGETRMLKTGDTYLIPGNVMHGAKTFDEPAKVLDIFSPVREEYKY
ncbi:MAG TPA: cupin domain-containing protein [Ignavibacteriaceae bacterium]|nr:cupin domain-containing protein [Ignavibacteriaceae bacterium]